MSQYVILGAGLDTFPYRQPSWGGSLTIYELNHPITQQWKRDRLKVADIAVPPNVRFVPISFESTLIPEALRLSDFAFGARTLCSWMAVAGLIFEFCQKITTYLINRLRLVCSVSANYFLFARS